MRAKAILMRYFDPSVRVSCCCLAYSMILLVDLMTDLQMLYFLVCLRCDMKIVLLYAHWQFCTACWFMWCFWFTPAMLHGLGIWCQTWYISDMVFVNFYINFKDIFLHILKRSRSVGHTYIRITWRVHATSPIRCIIYLFLLWWT